VIHKNDPQNMSQVRLAAWRKQNCIPSSVTVQQLQEAFEAQARNFREKVMPIRLEFDPGCHSRVC
jgi:hypothetical protein